MRMRPRYFDHIQAAASRRWDQLENDPDLAGPWRVLFKQVQSPRHVLSELLQNADDAGAREASVRIEDSFFIFEHDGEDFSEENFSALCKFGYSNKRTTHTIGFWGIGFKSTFSLGANVELISPSLSVRFNSRRFTLPEWTDCVSPPEACTMVRVCIASPYVLQEIQKNLHDWIESPTSLLFFRNLRRLTVNGTDLHWQRHAPGAIPGSWWMILNEDQSKPYLLIRSAPAAFPSAAQVEIREERGIEESIDLPPCSVDIVVGIGGRLFVVLPTDVDTGLPFACNAPFIQDPSRVKIKDPETSPTNRWLLERAGCLGASTMLAWLGSPALSMAERAGAYSMLPSAGFDISALGGASRRIARGAFKETIEGRPVLLTADGQLVGLDACVSLPRALHDVWPPNEAAAILASPQKKALCEHVAPPDIEKLLSWNLLHQLNHDEVIIAACRNPLPKPTTWSRLFNLWCYLAPLLTSFRHCGKALAIHAFPVFGHGYLMPAEGVVRLGERPPIDLESDWQFLSDFLSVLDSGWLEYLNDQFKDPEIGLEAAFDAIKKWLHDVRLDHSSVADSIITTATRSVLVKSQIEIGTFIRLASIAAKMGAQVPRNFPYVMRSLAIRTPEESILFDSNGLLEEIVPPSLHDDLLLHNEYKNVACPSDIWNAWIASGRAGIWTLQPLVEKTVIIRGENNISREARKRGIDGEIRTRYYRTEDYGVLDWDFDDATLEHWTALAAEDAHFWATTVQRILAQPSNYWKTAQSANLVQWSRNRSRQSISKEPAVPGWILRLRELPCLFDTHGVPRKPSDLHRRTVQTDPLAGIELFVDPRLDRPETVRILDLLGVASETVGAGRLLDRLRALAASETVLQDEAEKIYRRLDRLVNAISSDELAEVRAAFTRERLILTEDQTWSQSDGVFLATSDNEIPGIATVHGSVRDLPLWPRLHVAERPTLELAMKWLRRLPSSARLETEDARRVRTILARYPRQVWFNCGHWLSLSRKWVDLDGLRFGLFKQSSMRWSHLHEWVKDATADMQMLDSDIAEELPFTEIACLSTRIEERFAEKSSVRSLGLKEEWLSTLGRLLQFSCFEVDEKTTMIRELARRLVDTKWFNVDEISVIPYIDNVPAGTARSENVAWVECNLFVVRADRPQLAKLVPEKLGQVFDDKDIRAALSYCYGRPLKDVESYIRANFQLDSDEVTRPDPDADVSDHFLLSEPDGEKEEYSHDREAVGGPPPPEPIGDLEYTPRPGGEAEPIPVEPRKPRSRNRTHIMIEDFAAGKGFEGNGDGIFLHPDGSRIARHAEIRSLWECRDSHGALIRTYWPHPEALESGPLEIAAEIWRLIEQEPSNYAMVLPDRAGVPIELSGIRLQAMQENGALRLYPSTYRIVLG